VKNFWPYRSKAKGFSIRKFADKYLEKTTSVSSPEIENKFSGDRNLKPIKQNGYCIATSPLGAQRGHWANRDFSEYREAA